MVTALAFAAAVSAGLLNTAEFSWGYMPAPVIPPDNPLSAAKISLGRRLFHDTRLSINGTYSCATCHIPERHFTDGLARAVGATGQMLPHNTPTLYYSAFNASFGWLDSGAYTLEAQHLTPLFNTSPVEMGFDESLLTVLQQDAGYQKNFAAAFSATGAITTDNIIKALASYVRTLTPPATAFDNYVFEDDRQALSPDARAGMTLFFSPRLGCAQCHASLTLSGPVRHSAQQAEPVFHFMGVSDSAQAFRAPTLRHIRYTAPYMHDGSVTSLKDVLAHYQARPSERVPQFSLSAIEVRQLLAFLNTL